MENESSGAREGAGADPVAAREALAQLGADGSRLAERVATPWWYHPILGLVVAMFAVAQVLPTTIAMWLVVAGVVALPLLVMTYRHRSGLTMTQPAGPRSARFLFASVAVLVLAMAAALAFRLLELSAWWVILPAVAAFVLTVVLGRRYDAVLREEIVDAGASIR